MPNKPKPAPPPELIPSSRKTFLLLSFESLPCVPEFELLSSDAQFTTKLATRFKEDRFRGALIDKSAFGVQE
jgi:hypothetical protein